MLLLLITFFSFAQEKIWSFFKLFLTPHFNFGNRYKIFSSGKCTIVEISVIFNIFVEDKYSCLLNQHRSSLYLANAGCQPPSAILLPVKCKIQMKGILPEDSWCYILNVIGMGLYCPIPSIEEIQRLDLVSGWNSKLSTLLRCPNI